MGPGVRNVARLCVFIAASGTFRLVFGKLNLFPSYLLKPFSAEFKLKCCFVKFAQLADFLKALMGILTNV